MVKSQCGPFIRTFVPSVFHVSAALAEFTRELIAEGTVEGLPPPASAGSAAA